MLQTMIQQPSSNCNLNIPSIHTVNSPTHKALSATQVAAIQTSVNSPSNATRSTPIVDEANHEKVFSQITFGADLSLQKIKHIKSK